MSENPQSLDIDDEKSRGRARSIEPAALAALAIAAIGLRIAFLNVNQAEYTDGILQLTLFSKGNPYWPPLYSALAVPLGTLLGNLELGGRLVSALMGGLGVIPIAILGSKLGGRKAGIFAGLLYLVLPEALRWGVRVMTDATFLTLFATSLCFLAPGRRGVRVVWGTVFAVLATLTRYQGALLVFPVVWALILVRQEKRALIRSFIPQALWLAVPLWIFRGQFAHIDQVIGRTGADHGFTFAQTLLNYWNVAESYFYLFPYALTPTVLLVFLAGLFSPTAIGKGMPRWFLAMFVLSVLLIGGAQAVFVHFDFRYMYPLVAFVLPFGGLGLARLDGAIGKRRALAVVAYCMVLIPPLVFSILSIVNQREVFGDIRAASRFAAEETPAENRIFTNEFYNADFPVVKVSFWAGREAMTDPGIGLFLAQSPQVPLFRSGDTLILSSIYAPSLPEGGPGFFPAYIDYLSRHYRLTELGRFDAEFVPLLTDVMTVPGAHASPLAWIYRYQPQRASTLVLRVDGVMP